MKPDNTLTVAYMAKHPADAARVVENLPHSMTADLFERLDPEQYIPTLKHVMPSYAAELLDIMQPEPRIKLVGLLSSEQLSLLLTFFDKEKRNGILNQIPSEKRKTIVRQMQYPLDTVGSIMSPPIFSLPQDISVTEALKRIRATQHEHHSEIIVVDSSLRYIGMSSLGRLIQSGGQQKLSSIADRSIPALPTRKSLRNLSDDPAWTFVRTLPVIDSQGLLSGVLEYQSLLQHKNMEKPQTLPQQITRASVFELYVQALGTLTEGLAHAFFPDNKRNNTRAKKHDNAL